MVNLASDVTQEELQVFLQDTDEQLQLLDEDIIKLENESDDDALLQEIFRAAHTIKGSSAMLGYDIMAELTHAMENILDKLRHGELSVTTEIADALLAALDALRILRENLTAEEEIPIDVSNEIATLAELANTASAAQDADCAGKNGPIVATPLSEEGRKRLQELLSTGNKAYEITINIEEGSLWAAVRFFQVLNDLGEKCDIITSDPTMEEIEAEKVTHDMTLIVAGRLEEEEIRETINGIPDIEGIQIEPYDPSKTATIDEEPETEPDVIVVAEEIIDSASTQPTKSPDSSGKTSNQKVSETVRIDVERLDSLMNQIGELVVARTAFNRIGTQLSARYRDDEEIFNLSKTLTNISKIVDDLQLDITEARMMPVGTVFTRFPRLIRDLAHKAGKQVDFVMEGQETGIDRSVIEHIRDPLVHLLRNAVDHGIELPEVRQAVGKPPKATIRLTAAHDQSYIAITVEDDGKGIDGAALKEKAVKNGVITADTAARIDNYEAVDLIFEAGLSTAEKITDVSGRGVGMDIVKQNVEALNGIINVETKPGQGSTFTLKLPLTLATINGLLVSSGGVTYALPLVAVSETLRLNPEEIQTVTQREVIRLRDRVVPLLNLEEVLGTGVRKREPGEKVHIAVVKTGDRMVGLIVNSFKEPQEVVVKSLGKFVGEIKGIAGASILGTGEVALILDIPSLMKLVIMGE
ncbi:MAG: chemotaxis protein CheA [Chloroflexi bacterium]|jgi:two-component system, chemotaxis family, sensor kinase CheA|nr:chemotaxis protein CheA [Chloroflexota bacterium]